MVGRGRVRIGGGLVRGLLCCCVVDVVFGIGEWDGVRLQRLVQ
jgi:hypothetical protein